MAFRVLNLDIDQINIKTLFFYSLIDQLIYIQIPKGSTHKGKVCKLLKALYSLK